MNMRDEAPSGFGLLEIRSIDTPLGGKQRRSIAIIQFRANRRTHVSFRLPEARDIRRRIRLGNMEDEPRGEERRGGKDTVD